MGMGKLKVTVGEGVFSSERAASFNVGEKSYTLLVDTSELDGDSLKVRIVGSSSESVVIELPSDTPSGRRVIVPRRLVLPA